MADIAPDMLEAIRTQFSYRMQTDPLIKRLRGVFEVGGGTYEQVNEFAIRAGEILSGAYKMYISEAELPGGRMWYNIADKVLRPTLRNNYQIVADAAERVQSSLNASAGVGIKAIRPLEPADRIQNLIQKVSDYEKFSEGEWLLQEPVVNLTQSVVDDAIKQNLDFQGGIGMSAKVKRMVVGGCCEWCRSVAGSYEYPDVPPEVWQRHERCRCIIDYTPKKGSTERLRGTGRSWR